ncbi:MAG: SDR family oxidoreductase [Magnetococcales bacterium]|nr:SDR family oxidoreductase [Magnetococcales bacterium]
MNILIVGAGGFVGRRMVRRFLAEGNRVIGCGRNIEKLRIPLHGAELIAIDFNRGGLMEWLPRLEGVDVVINCAGVIGNRAGNRMEKVHTTGPQSLFQACFQAGVKQVIQISALGADPAGVTRYYQSKGQADAFLAGLDPQRNKMHWTIVRPSVVIGRGGDSNGLFAVQAAFPIMPRLGKGSWRIQPIHINDLVEMVFTITGNRESAPAWIEATGPEPMSTDELTIAFRRWLGLSKGRFIAIPEGMLRLAARIGDIIPLGALNSEALTMLMRDNVRSGSPPSGEEPFAARPLQEAMGAEPATRADLWEARLDPLRLPLRWALGLFWIISGVLPLLVLETNQEGYALLAKIGFEVELSYLLLHGAAAINIILGLMLLAPFHPRLAGGLQILFILAYSTIILTYLPEFLTQPFGPLTKNLPLLAATSVMMILEE